MDGLILAVMVSGLLLAITGWLRLGTFVKFVPYPVTVGFTAGISVIIFASQMKDLLGLTLDGPEPGPFVDKHIALVQVGDTFSLAALAISAGTMIVYLP